MTQAGTKKIFFWKNAPERNGNFFSIVRKHFGLPEKQVSIVQDTAKKRSPDFYVGFWKFIVKKHLYFSHFPVIGVGKIQIW